LLAKETAMVLSRIGAINAPAPRRCFGSPGLAHPRLTAGYHNSKSDRTCFCGLAKSSMFADMPLDNRTVDQFASLSRHRWLTQAGSNTVAIETT
jgi:hypothetical protein